MLNIVVPMAGRGSRFANAGYKNPKPLIDIYGHPMIEYVIKNITPTQPHRFIFICQEEHIKKYGIDKELERMALGCKVVTVDHITEGAACTVLLAEEYINNEDAMPASHPKWSYIKFDENGFVTLVREKEVISNEATVGIYNYKHGSDFVKYAHQMIDKNIRINNEFYVAPVYNEMIDAGMKIVFNDVGIKMFGTGTPEDLNIFMETDVCKKCF